MSGSGLCYVRIAIHIMIQYVQGRKLFCIFVARRSRYNLAWSQNTKPDVSQSTAKSPALVDIFLRGDVVISRLRTNSTQTSDNLLYCRFVDEVFKSQSVRIPELKLVVISQESQEEKRLKSWKLDFTVLNILRPD